MLETVIEDGIQKASTEFSKVKQDYSEKQLLNGESTSTKEIKIN